MEISGTTALVTGAAQRVGKGLAMAPAATGANVLIHYNRTAGPAEETAAAARALGIEAATGSADLGDPAGVAALVDDAASQLGPVRILVNSASGFPEDTLYDVELGQWNRTLALSLTAPMLLIQAVARSLSADLDGAVVNITDWRTARPYPDHFSYTVAKGALDVLTRAAALAAAPRLRVNAVALGAILPPPGKGSDYLRGLAGSLPLQRTGNVGMVADAVLHLVRNDFITGEIVRVDGGAHLA